MKAKHTIILVSCAALLAAFGIWHYTQSLGRTEQTVPNEIEDLSEDTLRLGLSAQTDAPAARGLGFAMTEGAGTASLWSDDAVTACPTGWYFISTADGRKTLTYADTETRTVLPLCPRPQCTHDGSDYCTATTLNYTISRPLYLDGAVYAAGVRNSSPGKWEQNTKTGVLLRYEPDGTSVSELARFGSDAEPCSDCIAHRGWLWVVLQKQAGSGENEGAGQTGWCIAGVEISSGRTVTLAEYMPPAGKNAAYKAPGSLWGDGSFLYFVNPAQDGLAAAVPELDGAGTYRISLRAGTVEKVSRHEAAYVSGGRMIYSDLAPDALTKRECYLLDLATGESTAIASRCKMMRGAFSDESRLYTLDFEDGTEYVQLRDLSGKLLQELPLQAGWHGDRMFVSDGRLYLELNGTAARNGEVLYDPETDTGHALVSAALDELAQGSAEWRPEVQFPEVPGAADRAWANSMYDAGIPYEELRHKYSPD